MMEKHSPRRILLFLAATTLAITLVPIGSLTPATTANPTPSAYGATCRTPRCRPRLACPT